MQRKIKTKGYQKKRRGRKMQERHIEFSLPKKTIEDLVAAHLYATTVVHDNEDIDFTDLGNLPEVVPIKIKLTKEVETQKEDG